MPALADGLPGITKEDFRISAVLRTLIRHDAQLAGDLQKELNVELRSGLLVLKRLGLGNRISQQAIGTASQLGWRLHSSSVQIRQSPGDSRREVLC